MNSAEFCKTVVSYAELAGFDDLLCSYKICLAGCFPQFGKNPSGSQCRTCRHIKHSHAPGTSLISFGSYPKYFALICLGA